MAVKPGYKLTEVGVIPEDWRVGTIGQISDVGRGRVISHREIAKSISQTYPVYSSQTSNEGVMGYLDTFDFDGEYITWTTDGANAGTVFYRNGRFNCTNVCGTIRAISDDTFFLSRALAVVAQKYVSHNLGNPKLMNDIVKRIAVAMPSTLPEQHAIATALSDVDTLLTKLDQLIAKKRDIKQATMQQFLTGQTRLPGFSGEWEVKRLGDVLKIRHGKNQRNIEVSHGVFPILASGGEIGRTNTFLYNKPSVLIGRKGTIDNPQYIETPFWTVDTLFYTEISRVASEKFIYFKFLMIDWRSFSEASGVPSLNSSTIESIEVAIPDYAEQQAIAAILSDMDAEITVLESRRNKTHALKQGMMQELLTGRIRLPMAKHHMVLDRTNPTGEMRQ